MSQNLFESERRQALEWSRTLTEQEWIALAMQDNTSVLMLKMSSSAIHRHWLRKMKESRNGANRLEELEQLNAKLVAVLERSLNWLSSYPGGLAENCYEQALAVMTEAKKSVFRLFSMDGYTWYDSPNDMAFVHTRPIGDRFTLIARDYDGKTQKQEYVVTDVPNTERDSYEVCLFAHAIS